MLTNGGLQLGGKDAMITNYPKSKKPSQVSIYLEESDTPEIRLKKTLLRNKHLVSLETDEVQKKENSGQIHNLSQSQTKKKKEIVSYTANRDTLFIPHPERPKRPVDIQSNLTEEEKVKPVADIGMQCDEIEYENRDKPFIPQKIGKDVGLQIEDGDLFNFDRDVEPLLTVLCGKILEQTDLELMEEAEMRNLFDTKAAFLRKFKAQKEEIKKLEEEEIKRKKEHDDIKKRRRLEKISKIDTQQKLVSRVFSKAFLRTFVDKTFNELTTRGAFMNYTTAIIKDSMNQFNIHKAQLTLEYNHSIDKTLFALMEDYSQNIVAQHQAKIKERRDMIQSKKEEAERRLQEELERQRKEEEDRLERRRVRKIKRIRESIRKTVFETPVMRNEYYLEDISEIDNYLQEGPYVGIYGGLMGSFLISLALLKKSFFPQDQYYTPEMFIEVLSNYLSECGQFNIYFDSSIEESIKEILNKEGLEINNLKGNTELVAEDWAKIGEVLSDVNLNYDYLLKNLIENLNHEHHSNVNFYSMIIKCLCSMIEKGLNIDKINFIFKSKEEGSDFSSGSGSSSGNGFANIKERFSKYQAFCVYELPDTTSAIIDTSDFGKDSKKKKPVKAPEFSSDLKNSKLYQKNAEHNVLIYDKTAEFIVRNKILEESIRAFNNELETKVIFKQFNEAYDSFVNSLPIFNLIQLYTFNASDFVVSENTLS